MACCCCFCCGVHINCKHVISVKENDYQAFFENSRTTTSGSDLPSVKLSPSYSEWSNPDKQGGFTDLITLAKFNVKRSVDEMGCFIVCDESGKQFKSSKDGQEIAQVLNTPKGVNGFFPRDLELGMKFAVIGKAIAQIHVEEQQMDM